MIFYGHNYTRPGIDPPQWYGVTQWRTTEREAREDMYRTQMAARLLEKAAGTDRIPDLIRSQHRIEQKEVTP